jgi:Helix-turn-helix domain
LRLNSQCKRILRLLCRQGRVSNGRLSRIALKYTGRISDLRAAGHKIECQRAQGGKTWYSLREGASL